MLSNVRPQPGQLEPMLFAFFGASQSIGERLLTDGRQRSDCTQGDALTTLVGAQMPLSAWRYCVCGFGLSGPNTWAWPI